MELSEVDLVLVVMETEKGLVKRRVGEKRQWCW